MSASAPQSRWVICPVCRSRHELTAPLAKTPKCRHCDVDMAPLDLDEAEYQLAESPKAPPVIVKKKQPKQELAVAAPAQRTGALFKPPPPDELREAPPDSWVAPPKKPTLGWAFLSNTFTFPWRQYALAQWIVGTGGMVLVGELAAVAVMALVSGGMAGGIGAGAIGLTALFMLVLTLSYASACLMNIVENTAYNLDKDPDWPDPDWRERTWFFIHMIYLAALSGIPGMLVGLLSSAVGEIWFWPACMLTMFLVFPVLLLSSLEADSAFVPFSATIWQSLATNLFGWLVFYGLSLGLLLVWVGLSLAAYKVSPFIEPLVSGPLSIAAVFVYGRLLGRLTYLIMRQFGSDLESKRANRVL